MNATPFITFSHFPPHLRLCSPLHRRSFHTAPIPRSTLPRPSPTGPDPCRPPPSRTPWSSPWRSSTSCPNRGGTGWKRCSFLDIYPISGTSKKVNNGGAKCLFGGEGWTFVREQNMHGYTLESYQGNQRYNKVDNLNLRAQPIASLFVRQPSAPSPGHSTAPWQHPSAGSPRSRSPPPPPPEEEEEEGQPRRRKRWPQQRRPESIARGDSGGQYTNDKFLEFLKIAHFISEPKNSSYFIPFCGSASLGVGLTTIYLC